MKITPLLAGLSLLLSIAVLPAQEAKTVENAGVSFNIPADWNAQKAPEPIIHVVADSKNTASAIVIREVKADMGAKDMEEYFNFKLEKLAGRWLEPQFGDTKSETIDGKKVLWKEGTATIVDPQGIKMPSKVIVASIEGKEHFYLVIMNERTSAGGVTDFATMLKSFKAL